MSMIAMVNKTWDKIEACTFFGLLVACKFWEFELVWLCRFGCSEIDVIDIRDRRRWFDWIRLLFIIVLRWNLVQYHFRSILKVKQCVMFRITFFAVISRHSVFFCPGVKQLKQRWMDFASPLHIGFCKVRFCSHIFERFAIIHLIGASA